MTRKKKRARAVKNGHQQSNFSTHTSPSVIEAQSLRNAEYNIGQVLPRRHPQRQQTKKHLIETLGLPADTVFLFRRCITDDKLAEEREIFTIRYGTVVVIDAVNLSLVLAVRFTNFSDMSTELRAKFNHSISSTYHHTKARNPVTTHTSMAELDKEDIFFGRMGVCGWRAGCDKGKSFGCHALSSLVGANGQRIRTDRDRMENFHTIRDFWADRFVSLSLAKFKANQKLASKSKVPGFDQLEWDSTPSGTVFASNLVVTHDGFYNMPHTNNNRTNYAFGMFCLIDCETGQPYQVGCGESRGDVKGTRFTMRTYGIVVDFDHFDGSGEMMWDSKIEHFTTPSRSFDSDGQEVAPDISPITRYGSSCQISESLVRRIEILQEQKSLMCEEDWKELARSWVKSYDDESDFKLMRLEGKKKKC